MALIRIPDGVGAIAATAPGQMWYLAAGDKRSNFATNGTFSPGAHSDVSLVVAGTLESGNNFSTVVQTGGGTGFNMHVEASGRVVSLGPVGDAVHIASDYFNLLNEGRIVAKGLGNAVNLTSGSEFGTVVNEGLIKSVGSWGVILYDTSTLINHGQIVSTAAWPYGAVGIGGDGNSIFNDGVIRGNIGVFFQTSPGDTNSLFNEGRIVTTGTHAIFGSNGSEKVINRGLLDGDVELFGGNDTLDNRGGDITGSIDLGDGSDTFLGGTVREVVRFGPGHDTARMGGGNDKAIGDLGNDMMAGGAGDDLLRGQDGNDILKGGIGSDRLVGGNNDDYLSGGRGNDVLIGGTGADVFQFGANSGNDRIRDFDFCVDKVDLSALGVANFNQVMNHASMTNGNTVIDLTALGGSGQLTLVGIAIASLDASDFFL